MPLISAVILTFNESENIGNCLHSLEGIADELIIVDSYSTDDTETICKEFGAKFFDHQWEGYGGSRNFGISKASHDWILYIDADEELSEELRQSILKIKDHPKTLFYKARMVNYFCGKWIWHTAWYPAIKTRLFDRRIARWNHDIIHERLLVSEPVSYKLLKGHVLHYGYRSVEQQLQKYDSYSLQIAQVLFDRGKRISRASIWPRACYTFFKSYILKHGFLDGYHGFLISKHMAYYTRMKYNKLYRMQVSERLLSRNK